MRGFNTLKVLDGSGQVEVKDFGRKAALLYSARKVGLDVPAGFCISTKLCDRIANSESREKYVRMLAGFVRNAVAACESSKLIVRSSSRFEDHANGQFAGLFDSYSNVETTEDVVHCIEKIVKNSSRSGLLAYYERVKRDPSEVHMGVIVQCQVDTEYSGIAAIKGDSIYVEAVRGHLTSMLSGSERALCFSLAGDKFEYISKGAKTDIQNTAAELASKLQSMNFKQIANHFGDCVVEFGIVDGRGLIFQIRDTYEAEIDTADASTEFAPGVSKSFGSKAAAMQFFSQNGLFSKPLRIVKAGVPIGDAMNRIEGLFEDSDRITVRFSRGNDIGLPRAFVSDPSEAKLFLQSNYQRDFTTIAHEYIDVIRSFELLIGHDFAVLEHVPGMWESNITLHPDVISISGTSAEAFVFNSERVVKLEHSGETIELKNPISDEQLNQFIQLLTDVADVVRGSSVIELPVNVHVVWDAISDGYHCINIRKGFEPQLLVVGFQMFHEVKSTSDLSSWDGKSAIRLKLQTERGEENRLIVLAKALSEIDATLVVDFGLLSHPAMVLRDFGCKLIPSYRVPQLIKEDGYTRRAIKVDSGEDAFERIVREPHIRSTDSYFVLEDREPITSHHFLGVMKTRSPSVADSRRVDEVCYLFEEFSKDADSIFYFERGRASFCSSGFGSAHDHFHLVGDLDCENTFRRLAEKVRGRTYPDLKSAYDNAPISGEYCVFGCEKIGFMVSDSRVFGKRMFRECVVRSKR